MSLFIVGSVSRVTSNIVLQLARAKMYNRIVVGDLLPQYSFHHRFYNLQRDLDNLQIKQDLQLQKIHQVNDLHVASREHSDVLFVTHDYYQHVTSKTKLMELTAQAFANKSHLFFATPVEYDHFGFENPEANYLQAQRKVNEIAPNSTVIRSDVQDQTEAFAYINFAKGFPDAQIYNFYASEHFAPKVVNAQHYAQVVVDTIQNRTQGKSILVQGPANKKAIEVNYNKNIDPSEYEHAKINIARMTSKYSDIIGEGCERSVQAQN